MALSFLPQRTNSSVGLAIGLDYVEALFYQPGPEPAYRQCHLPAGQPLLNATGDQVLNPLILAPLLRQALIEVGAPAHAKVHVSIPGSLVRLVELPKMQRKELYLSLSSESERYKSFDGSEALVDFKILDGPASSSPLNQKVLFASIRKDTLAAYQTAFRRAKIPVASLDIDENNLLRAMAATGVLDNLFQQIGEQGLWGTLFAGNDRIRILIWKGDQILVLREISLSTQEHAWDDTLIDDLVEELRRTGQSLQGEFPVVWMTHGVPEAVAQTLGQRYDTPFVACQMLLPASGGFDSVAARAVYGAAYRPKTSFPFDLNLNRSKAQVKTAQEAEAPISALGDEAPPLFRQLMLGSAAAAVLVAVLWVGGMLWTGILSGNIARLEGEQATYQGEMAQLTQQYQDIKSAYELKASLLAVSDKAQIRNQIALSLGQDLKKLTPPSVWLNEIEVSDAVTLKGNALHHSGAINFARNLDQTDYTNAVMINEMKEGFLGDNPVYNFTVKGNVYLNPNLVPPAKATEQSPSTPPSM